jgi:hypothetical protein
MLQTTVESYLLAIDLSWEKDRFNLIPQFYLALNLQT